MPYIAVNVTERLICESNSELQLIWDDPDIEALDDLSEDADSSFPVDTGLKYVSLVWIVMLLFTWVSHLRLFSTNVCRRTIIIPSTLYNVHSG
jgi:hypothetical protein